MKRAQDRALKHTSVLLNTAKYQRSKAYHSQAMPMGERVKELRVKSNGVMSCPVSTTFYLGRSDQLYEPSFSHMNYKNAAGGTCCAVQTEMTMVNCLAPCLTNIPLNIEEVSAVLETLVREKTSSVCVLKYLLCPE